MKAELKTSDLRLGNYIQVEGKISKIDGIQPHWVWFDNISSSNMDNIEPIPLDEAWLINMGFKDNKPFLLFSKKYHQIDFNVFSWETPVGQSNGVPADEFYIIINGSILILNTVHQLQNLYHSLTREELTVSM